MPNNATQLYHKNPILQIVLDFLERCTPDGQRMTARYENVQEFEPIRTACADADIYPVAEIPEPGQQGIQPCLRIDRADWLKLSESAMPQLVQELRKRLPAINAALKLAPVKWDALALADGELALWGTAAGMIALPARTVFDYFGSRYPADAPQRGKYAVVTNVGRAAVYQENQVPGFLLSKAGSQNFACSGEDWRAEVTSARALVNHHISLMLKVGLQMLEAGASFQLKEMRSVLAMANETPSLARLKTLLEVYEDHVANYGAGQNRFRNKLLESTLGEFQAWQDEIRLAETERANVGHDRSAIGKLRPWKWVDSGVDSQRGSNDLPDLTTAVVPEAQSSASAADPVIEDGVIIPNGVRVARGAHVRVCAISSGTRLKPGTVLHGDVSIASHTRFEGPLTIMHDVRIGWGLTFGPGLILTEGATVSTFTVQSPLPPGTRIAGSLRVGGDSTVSNNVSFGAENWIGSRVRIGENVRFGPYVKVDDGVSIGANAFINGNARLTGNVPANANVVVHSTGAAPGKQHAGPSYAVHTAAFTMTKGESTHDRPPPKRQPLAARLDTCTQVDDTPHVGSKKQTVTGRPADKSPPKKTATVASPATASIPDRRPEVQTPPVPGTGGNRSEDIAKGPAGLQRKRGGETMIGRPAKRLCTGLEARYQEAETGEATDIAAPAPAMNVQDRPFSLARLLNNAPVPLLEFATTGTSTASAWLDQQSSLQRAPNTTVKATAPIFSSTRPVGGARPAERRQTVADIAAARPAAHESSPAINAQRKSGEAIGIGRGPLQPQNRETRQSIRVPPVSQPVKDKGPLHMPTARQPGPMAATRGPTL